MGDTFNTTQALSNSVSNKKIYMILVTILIVPQWVHQFNQDRNGLFINIIKFQYKNIILIY